jgi:hypothetical protein
MADQRHSIRYSTAERASPLVTTDRATAVPTDAADGSEQSVKHCIDQHREESR